MPSPPADFDGRPIMADYVDEEGLAQSVRDAFVRKEISHVEEVARMLPVEGSHELSGVEIIK